MKTIQESLFDYIQTNCSYSEEQTKQIIDKIEYYTNKNLNFDMYFDYNDEIPEEYIQEFLNKNKNKFNNIVEAKDEFSYFIEEKFDWFFDSEHYYFENLHNELSKLEFYDEDIMFLYDLQSELWILYLDRNIFDIVNRRWYKIALFSMKDHDVYSTCFFDWRYNDWKEDKEFNEEKSEFILQKLCKVNDFDINDIFKYQVSEEWSEDEKKLQELKKNNVFFSTLYQEFSNTFWYQENLVFLCRLDIDEILQFCVKNTQFNLNNVWSIWLYWYWSWSLFEIENRKDCIVNTSELDIAMYSRTNIESVYWFCDCVFW